MKMTTKCLKYFALCFVIGIPLVVFPSDIFFQYERFNDQGFYEAGTADCYELKNECSIKIIIGTYESTLKLNKENFEPQFNAIDRLEKIAKTKECAKSPSYMKWNYRRSKVTMSGEHCSRSKILIPEPVLILEKILMEAKDKTKN